MARGAAAKEGDTRIAKNGYHYTRTAIEWRLTHHIIAEEKYGRKVNTEKERVVFVDGKRDNLIPSNIEIREQGKTSTKRRIAQIEARILELEAEKAYLEDFG